MATINLGAIKFNWKGAYAGGTAYAVDDVVSSGGSSYVCILASTGNATSNGTYWEQMSSAGTNGTDGTDLSTTLTTQGDILYRDGSGLQRLAKGTANQELRINSGATAPEWHTPAVASSDFVRITTNTLGSDTTTWSIDNVFSATYKNYIVKIALRCGSAGGDIVLRYLDNSGSEVGLANYRGQAAGSQNTSSGANNTEARANWGTNAHYITGFGDTLGSYQTPNAINLHGTLNFTHPFTSSGMGYMGKMFNGLINWTGSSGDRSMLGYVGGYYNQNLQARGFILASTTGNGIGANSQVVVYGLKQ
jgi:hypothetical protein